MKQKNETEIVNETKEDIGFDARPSTVFYEQWYKIIKDLPPKEREKTYKYIFEYAFYGIEPDKDKTTSMSYVVFSMAKPNIDSAQKRYDAASENGHKGGRPKKVTEEVREKIVKLRKNGLTQKEVAIELGLSLKTIQRVEKDISQNHNVNVNDNVNGNVNVNSVAFNEDNTETASPITESATPTSQPPQTELNWEQYTSVMDMWESSQGTGKNPSDIAKELNLDVRLCNQAVTEYKLNNYTRREKPKVIIKEVPLLNGGYLDRTREELFNEATNNGKSLVEEVAWKELESGYIMFGLAPITAKQLTNEFKQKLKDLHDATVLQRVASK